MDKINRITFEGEVVQLWSNSKINTFYSDPDNQIPINIVAYMNKIGRQYTEICLCDQVQNYEKNWIKKLQNYCYIIDQCRCRMLKVDCVIEKIEIKANWYPAASNLVKMIQKVQNRFSIPLIGFRKIG